MNSNIIIFLCSVIGLSILFSGCEKEYTDYSIQDLLGNWEFIAFGDSDRSLRDVQKYEFQPGDAFTITFHVDTTMTGRSLVNTLAKKFVLAGNKISFPWGVLADEFGETGDPYLFTEALRNVSSFTIEDDKIKLFYPDRKFLLFNFETL